MLTKSPIAKRAPPKAASFIGHHNVPTNEDLVRSIVREFRPLSFDSGRALTPDDEPKMVAHALNGPTGTFGNTRFEYARPSPGVPPIGWGSAELIVGTTGSKYDLTKNKRIVIPLFEREDGHWYMVTAGRINARDSFESNWFLEKVIATFPLYEPDFGFGALHPEILTQVGDEPRRRPWPLLLYGPRMIDELGGRERVRATPAWRVDDLPDGRLLVQVAENPFVATDAKLRAVAKHLGLDAP